MKNLHGKAQKYFNECMSIETDDCINWKFWCNENGYGMVCRDSKLQYVTRLALQHHIGEPPKGKPNALHSCHNPSCFNYRHLRWGNQKENRMDMITDGTVNNGQHNGMAILTPDVVLKIRMDDRPQKIVAQAYNTSQPTVSKIKCKKAWINV